MKYVVCLLFIFLIFIFLVGVGFFGKYLFYNICGNIEYVRVIIFGVDVRCLICGLGSVNVLLCNDFFLVCLYICVSVLCFLNRYVREVGCVSVFY